MKGLTVFKNLATLDLADQLELTGLVAANMATTQHNFPASELGGVTDAGLKELAALKQLTSLNLGSCWRVTDAGLKELAALKNLTSLSLRLCQQVTVAGLKELAALKQLTTLDLSGTRVTDEGVTELQQALPNCKILK